MNNQDNNQWIDVDVEQPQDDFEVLVCCDDDVFLNTFRYGYVQGEYYFDIEIESEGRIKPTHWQPKPEPF